MKKIVISSILIVSLTAGVAFAQGGGWGRRGQGNCSGVAYGMQGQGMQGQGMMGSGYRMKGNRGGYGGRGGCGGPGFAQMGQWNESERQVFLDATLELRKELAAKRFDFREASRGATVDNDKLATIEKEMIDLRTKIQNKAEELSSKKVINQ